MESENPELHACVMRTSQTFPDILEFNWNSRLEKCIDYICEYLFNDLEEAMQAVGDELRLFGEKGV